MQVVAAAAMEAPPARDPDTIKDALVAVFQAMPAGRPGPLRARPVRRLPRRSTASPPDSTTETYAAMRLEIDNWRWSGVPFFIRTGKHLPATQTELRLVFATRRGWASPWPPPDADQLVVKLDPSTGVRLLARRQRAASAASPSRSTSTWSSAGGRRGPAPYEVLLHAAMQGDSRRFTRQDGVEEAWRIMQPLLDAPAAGQPVREGARGARRRRTASSPATAAGTDPWVIVMSDYDVIVIGSGAGGGTLVHHLAPSGKRILLLERGDWLPREPQNWSAQRRLRRQPLRLRRTPGTTRDGKPFQPQVHYFVGGATKLYGAALYRLREEDFGELRHHDGISPAWPIGYDEMEPYYTQAEQLYQVHGARGEDPTEPPASGPYPFPAVSHEPRIQQLSDDLAAAGPPPLPRALRRHARRGTTCRTAAACAAPLRRLPVPRAREVRRRGARRAAGARAPERHAADERRGRAARDQPGRHRGHRGRRSTATGPARPSRPTSSSCRAARPTRPAAARLGERQAPERPRQRLRPGRSQLHVPQQPGGAGALRRRTRPSSRRPSASTTSTSAATTSSTRSATSRWSASRRRRCTAARSRSRRGWRRADARGGRPPRGRLLALDRGPAAAREPRHAGPRGAHQAELHADQRGAEAAAAPQAQVAARAARHAPATTSSPHAYLKNEIPVAGVRHQAGTCRFGTDPATSVLDTDCRRTRSTTCTSSTRASSRASGR